VNICEHAAVTADNWWLGFLVALLVALGVAAVVALVAALVSRVVGRRWRAAERVTHAARLPFRSLLVVIAISSAVYARVPRGDTLPEAWQGPRELLTTVLQVAIICASAWLLAIVALVFEGLVMRRYRVDAADNRVARRVQTQLAIIRRLTIAVIVVFAVGASLLQFPGVEAIGASVLASAGLISVVAALAAQSTLGNVIAGIQLAFNEAIRLDDVVIVENEWGRIEEITLSYVVVHLWDDRRLVLPSTYFTTTPFQNWTRHSSELLGAVEFDLDWRVSPNDMRDELDRLLEHTELWDQRVKVLQVTDATAGYVRIRILVTAVDAPTLFDLRCYIREHMVEWLQANDVAAIPRTRIETVPTATQRQASRPVEIREPEGLFTGESGAARAAQFTGPMQTIDTAQLERAEAEDDDELTQTKPFDTRELRGRGDDA
jgi:small-conductance mechanosensitive channel